MAYWVGTSWKMNKTLAEATDFARGAGGVRPGFRRPHPALRHPALHGGPRGQENAGLDAVKVGAQNMHWADAGAWTGEISPVMLTDCGLDLVELGHSERREHFGETDNTVGLKTAAAVKHGLVPLICVGETLAQRNSGQADAVLALQVHGALQYLEGQAKAATILFAYEPVWAIGDKGIPASADYADRQQALIKKIAGDLLPAIPPVLYGGSVNPQNAAELIGQPHIDGLFIGRSAWQAEGYIDILQRASAAI